MDDRNQIAWLDMMSEDGSLELVHRPMGTDWQAVMVDDEHELIA